jgi:carboxypeptidase Taq
MNPSQAYDELVRLSRDRSLIVSCLEVLDWDQLTYMPRGGAAHRGSVLAHLTGLAHERATSPRIGELLACVEHSQLMDDTDDTVSVNVSRWRWQYDRYTRVPRRLAETLALETAVAQQHWAIARQNQDFRQFLPWLERIVHLKREEARCLCPSQDPYEALLADFEPGISTTQLQHFFAELGPRLSDLLSRILGSSTHTSDSLLRRDYPIDRQRVFAEQVAAEIGFDFERGRLDATTHPFFSAVGPDDCRITVRYSGNDFSEAFFSMLHELGHGLYEQGLDPTHAGTPLGESASLAIHESQSRLWENGVGRSLAFWRHFFPRVREVFHDSLRDISLDSFYHAINHVQPGWCRVRADEVTYDLHVLVRFELEQALIRDDLPPADIPAAWNELYDRYLGVTPADDAQGCLQDGHWSAGQFGYFPTYTLGNLYAAQIFAAARTALPDLDEQLGRGEFGPLVAWFREQIYVQGQRYSASELVERIAHSPPNVTSFLDALEQKYANIYRW